MEIRPHSGPQEEFLKTSADVALYGGQAGGGKTFALEIEPMRHVLPGTKIRGFSGVIFRRSCPEIMNPGGLWDQSMELYPLIGGKPYITRMKWKWEHCAGDISFDHLEDDKSLHKWQGSELCYIGFDELTHFTERQFWYLFSRNRSTCGVRPYIRATCNPDGTSWVADFIAWWINEDTGLAIPERSGVIRWFCRHEGQIEWGATKEELVERLGYGTEPKSFTFIPAAISDNPTLMEKSPEYVANLKALPYIERERLLGGNWKLLDHEGARFPNEYFEQIWPDWFPSDFPGGSAVGIDPSRGTVKGDYHAIAFAGLHQGLVWVDAVIVKCPTAKMISYALDMIEDYHPDTVASETNLHADLMQTEFDRQCEERKLPPILVEPVYQYSGPGRHRWKKEDRIERLGQYFKRHKFRFRPGSAGCQMLERQCRGFGLKEVPDDGPDALEIAFSALTRLVNRRGGQRDPNDEYVYA